jgi:hypothetical protein
MAFPAGLSNGQTTTINGVVYVYSATDNAWTRVSTPFGNLAINGNLSANIATFTGNLYANANAIVGNLYLSSLSWANGTPVSFSTYSNSNVTAYLTDGTINITNLAVGDSLIQQDVLNLNNNNLYNVNTIRINDPGSSEGISWEGGSGWNIYESPNDLSNATGNLQIVLSGVRALTVDTNQTVNIPSTWAATSATTGALTVGGGVGIGGNLWVTGNIYASNLVSIGSTTLSVVDPLLYLTASSPSPYNYDIGFYSHFVGGSLDRYQHTGFSRNSSNNVWTLFSNVFTEPGATISWTEANIIYDPIKVGSANIANTTISTSTTTGALVVGGGAGIAGALNVGGNITVGNVISDTYYSVGGSSRFSLTDIGLVAIAVAGQEYKFGASGIESSPGIYGGSYSGNKLSLNNETNLIANRYDVVKIQTGTDGSIQNEWTFSNNALSAPGQIIALGNIVAANTTVSTSTTTGALVVGGGAGIAGNAYVGGNIVVTSNVSANKFYTAEGLYWSGNGVAFSSGGGGGGGTVDYVASSTAPVSPDDGDFWYQTTTGILFQYLSDGTTSYWFDTQTETVSGVAYTNANVEAYIGANIGSYQTYANANAATQATSINTINAAINNIISPFLLAGM